MRERALIAAPLLAALAGGSCSALIGADFGDYQAGEGGGAAAPAAATSTSSTGEASSSSWSSSAATTASTGGDGGASVGGGAGGEGGTAPSCGPPPESVTVTKSLAIAVSSGELHFGALVATGEAEAPLELVGTYMGTLYSESAVAMPPSSGKAWAAFRAPATADDLDFVSVSALGASAGTLEIRGAARTGDALTAGGTFTGAFTPEDREVAVGADAARALVVRAAGSVDTVPGASGDGPGESLVAAVARGPREGHVVIVGATEEAEPELGLAQADAPSSSAFFLAVLQDGVARPAALVSPQRGPEIACDVAPGALAEAFARGGNDVDVAVLDDDRVVVAGTTCGAIRSPAVEARPSEGFVAPYRLDAEGGLLPLEGLHLGDEGPAIHAIRAVTGAGGRVLVGGVADDDLADPPLELLGVERAGFVAEATLDGAGAPRWVQARAISDVGLEDVNDLLLADGRLFVTGPIDGQTGSVIAELDGELEVVWSREVPGVSVRELVLVDCVLFAAAGSGTPTSAITILRLPL